MKTGRLVQKLQRVGVPQRAIREPDRDRIPVVLHGKGRVALVSRPIAIAAAIATQAAVSPIVFGRTRRLTGRSVLSPPLRRCSSSRNRSATRPSEPRHHPVAGVDAQAAIDASEVRSFPNVDADRTYCCALAAIDTVARRLALEPQLGGLLGGRPLLAAIIAIVDGVGFRIPDRAL